MKLIVGLGNPGLRYSNTRHNIGFKAVGLFAKRHNIKIKVRISGAMAGWGAIAGRKVMVAMPQSFMNLSGCPVKALIDKEKITVGGLLVVCDDVNMPFGRLRLRASGSAGGHKGLKSIIENLGAQSFARLRVGVGREGLEGGIADFVLSGFTKDEKGRLAGILGKAADCCAIWVEGGAEIAANKYNRKIC